MKKRTKFTLASIGAVALVATGVAVNSARGADEDEGPPAVTVVRGDLVDKALAVGTIEPDVQVSVKSKVSGVLGRAFAEEGDVVQAGDPLFEIRPDPTPLELVEARRALELNQIELESLRREAERQRALVERGLISRQDMENAQRLYDEAVLEVERARDRLQLLEHGRISGAAGVESVVRAPVSGAVLEQMVETGDPVVPLTSYQEGTVMATMADMSRLIFRGTVDEIDVGRLHEGMPVEIRVGALPDAPVTGRVARISLKAKTEESATTFPVEIALDPTPEHVVLRAGYSASADVIIQRRDDVVLVPERTITWEDGGAWVTVLGPDGTPERRTIRTGLSDAISVEVLDGLEPGERVLEKPIQTVS